MPKYEVKNYTNNEKAKILDDLVKDIRDGEINTMRQLRSKLKVLLKDKKLNRKCKSKYCDCIAFKNGLCRRHYFSPLY